MPKEDVAALPPELRPRLTSGETDERAEVLRGLDPIFAVTSLNNDDWASVLTGLEVVVECVSTGGGKTSVVS